MGSRREKRGSALAVLVLLASFQIGSSQSTIRGFVRDSLDASGVFATVVLKDASEKTMAYAVTERDGSFLLETHKEGLFYLQVSSFSYQRKSIEIEVSKGEDYTVEISLKFKPVVLNEVVVEEKPSMIVKQDTIVFDAQSFAQGNEEVVEDLLTKIPGINIVDGTIKVGGQEIEKVMVEGDDFFGKGYKILTKNMPSQPIGKIEVLQNYADNKLLKGVEESDKAALNLKLKEDAKRVWFGNIKAGYDLAFNNRYEAEGNLMNFGEKNKFYFLAGLNNTGYDATGDINHLIRPFRFNESASVGDDQSVVSVIALNAQPLQFRKSRTNFNNAQLLSLNAIFNPIEKVKVKTLAFFNWDENRFFRNRLDNVNVRGTNFANTEEYVLTKPKKVAFGKVDIIYSPTKNQMIEVTTKYSLDDRLEKGNLVFNKSPTLERMNHRNRLFDQKLTYTKKIKEKTSLLLTGRYIDEQVDQTYRVNNYFFQGLFSNTQNIDNMRQSVGNGMKFFGVEAHLLNRRSQGNLMELKLGNRWRRDNLNSEFTLQEEQVVANDPAGFQNNLIYQTNDVYFDGKYRYEFNSFSLIGKIELHTLFNQIKSESVNQFQNPFFVNPSVGLDWKINDMNQIKASYSYNSTNVGVMDVYDHFILNNFRNFSKGTGKFNQLAASSMLLNYRFGNWSDRFFANIFLVYTKSHDFLSSNTTVVSNYSLSKKMLIKDRDILKISANFDYYFKKLSSNLKIALGCSKSNFKNIVNNSNVRKVSRNNYRYGGEFRSAFDGFFNFNVGSQWTSNEVITRKYLSFTNNLSFIDLSFVVNKKWDIQIQTERYFFGNLKTDNTYYFLDFGLRYQIKDNKLSLEVKGKNLLNTKTFRSFSISDIGTSTTEYRLLPRFVLVKVKYRF